MSNLRHGGFELFAEVQEVRYKWFSTFGDVRQMLVCFVSVFFGQGTGNQDASLCTSNFYHGHDVTGVRRSHWEWIRSRIKGLVNDFVRLERAPSRLL